MDVFALLFILSFIALLVTLVVMNLYKKWKMKSKVAEGSKHIGWVSDMLGRGYKSTELYDNGKMHDVIVGKTTYETVWDVSSTPDRSVWSRYKQTDNNVEFVDCAWSDESWMKQEVNETQEKWKETIPKHTTRIKNRNRRKGHSKTVRSKKK